MLRCSLISVSLLALLTGCASTVDQAAPSAIPMAEPGLSAATELTRIGFGSCLHQERPQPILQRVVDEEFELFLMLGDNVYGDVDRDNLNDLTPLRQAYEQQGQSAGLKALRRSTPMLVTWDDHDYGLNDAGADFAQRKAAEQIFEEFWDIPAESAGARRPGVYDSAIFGPVGRRVQVLLLDTRYFRSPLQPTDERAPGKERYVPDDDPAKTMLGQAQWDWLQQELKRPAELRLVVSSIQVIADGHGWEAWRTLPTERQRLYDLLRQSGAKGLVLLSGDRHRAGIYRHEKALDYPLYEITSSSLNLPIRDIQEEAGPFRLGPTYMQENYGAIEIDWAAGIVALSVRDLQGKTVLEQEISLPALGSSP